LLTFGPAWLATMLDRAGDERRIVAKVDLDEGYRAWLDQIAANPKFGWRDRKGTANYIDEEARRRAVAAMRTGRCSTLARPLAIRSDPRPGEGLLTVEVSKYDRGELISASDVVHVAAHGQRQTHLDGLNHYGRNGTWYSGFGVEDPDGPSIADLAEHKLFTRGVIADIPSVRGTDWVDPGSPVTAEDIDAALHAAGVTFEPGDALLLYMGRDRWEQDGNELDLISRKPTPGAGSGAAHWIADHQVSLLCWDFLDAVCDDEPTIPVHLLIWAVGLLLVDNCNLGPTVAAARADRSAVGALVVAPPPLPTVTGCLVDPLFIQ
jgi:kynurenine formamidase